MNFFGLLTFKAPFLPWVLFGFSLMLGNSVMVDLIGKLHVLLSINVDGLVIPFASKVQKQCRSGALLNIKCCNLFFIYSLLNKTTLQMYGAMQFLIYLNYTTLCQKSSQRTLVINVPFCPVVTCKMFRFVKFGSSHALLPWILNRYSQVEYTKFGFNCTAANGLLSVL